MLQTVLETSPLTLTRLLIVADVGDGQHRITLSTEQSNCVTQAPCAKEATVLVETAQPLAPVSMILTFSKSTLPTLHTMTLNVTLFVRHSPSFRLPKLTVPPAL